MLTPEEQALVDRYRLADHILTQSQAKIDTVRGAVQGITEAVGSVEVLLNNESSHQEGVQQLLPACAGRA